MKKTLSFEKDLTFQTMIGEVTTISFEEDLKFINKSNIEGNFYISGKYKMTEASTLLEDFAFSVPIEIALLENYDLETTKISVLNFSYEVIDDATLRSKIDILVEGREEVILEEEKLPITENLVREDLQIIEETTQASKEAVKDQETSKELSRKEPIKEATIVEETCTERECDGDLKKDTEMELPIKDNSSTKKETTIIQETNNTTINNQETTQIINNQTIEDSLPKQQEETKPITKPPTDLTESFPSNEPKRDDLEEKEAPAQQPSIKVNSLFSNLGDSSDTFTTYSVYIMREGDNLEKVMDKYKVKREQLEVYNDLSTVELNSKVIIPSSSDE